VSARIAVVASAVAATLGVYALARPLYLRTKSVLALPVLVTATVVGATLLAAHIEVGAYVDACRPLSFVLGPATVALAIPLHRERARLRRHARTLLLAIGLGALSAMGSVVALARLLALSPELARSLVPKSVTTPIAMPIAARIGGVPEIAAALVVVTGTLGMVAGPWLLSRAGVRTPIARGAALGTAAHGIGTARAFDEGRAEGATASVAMVLAGVITALLAPIFARWLAP
jgi:predicted murein hydrolase (TIGR00659 family)